MAMDGNNLVFIDVEASTPAIKVEHEELPDRESVEFSISGDTQKLTQKKECNDCDTLTSTERKKVAFSTEERQLIVSLVEQFPVISDKRTNSRYIILKKRAWERITMAYNAQSFVARRTARQLKRCWENMKSRKMVNGHTHASSEPNSLKDQEMEIPSVCESKTDKNTLTEDNLQEKTLVNRIINNCSLVSGHKKMNLADEVDIRVKRCAINIQHDEILHKLRVDRETLLLEREVIQHERDGRSKDFEEQYHNLQLEKLKMKPARKENRPANRFKCNMCNYKTYHHALFKEHLNRHTGIKPFKCELCPYASVSKKYIKMHQDKHKTCLCGFLSQNRSEFKRHVKKCGKNPASLGSHVCPSCKKEYVDEKALANHIARRGACSLCTHVLCVTEVRAHMAHVHNVRLEQNKKETFHCSLCPWSSSFHQKILLHLIHHPNQSVDGCIDVTILRTCGILTRV